MAMSLSCEIMRLRLVIRCSCGWTRLGLWGRKMNEGEEERKENNKRERGNRLGEKIAYTGKGSSPSSSSTG